MSLSQIIHDGLPGISPGVYNAANFQAVSAIVHADAGIVLPAGKAMLVYSRLAPLVRASGCGTFSVFVDLIRSDPEERARAVAALTTNHTFFYREAHHFEHFAQAVRPGLLRNLEEQNPVRLWSAGCSSGEETWSLVMTLLGDDRAAGRRIAAQDLRVLASDLAPHALKKGMAATYPVKDLAPVPAGLVRQWTTEAGGKVTMTEDVRALVRFRILNLQEEWPMTRRFNVIFCRNVMIYFDHQTRERLVARLGEMLAAGGFLYIGHSERVTGPALALLRPVGPTIYQRGAA